MHPAAIVLERMSIREFTASAHNSDPTVLPRRRKQARQLTALEPYPFPLPSLDDKLYSNPHRLMDCFDWTRKRRRGIPPDIPTDEMLSNVNSNTERLVMVQCTITRREAANEGPHSGS